VSSATKTHTSDSLELMQYLSLIVGIIALVCPVKLLVLAWACVFALCAAFQWKVSLWMSVVYWLAAIVCVTLIWEGFLIAPSDLYSASHWSAILGTLRSLRN
jgi:hypothetical protein